MSSSSSAASSLEPSKHQRRRSALRGATSGVAITSAFAAVLALVAPPSAQARDAQWDSDGIDAPAGGPGQWDSLTPRWLITTDYEPWGGQDDAILGGTGGALQLQEDTFLNSLRFDAPGYAITIPTTLTGAGTTPSLIFNGSGVIDTGANDADVFARIGGASDLVKRGAGTLFFHGGNNFTGNTLIEAGTLALGNTLVADLPTTTNITISQGATLSLAPFGGSSAFSDTVGSITGEGNIVLGGSPGFGNATGSHLTIEDHGINGVISGNITGDGGRITKSGAGTLKLGGTNTYSGHTRVFGGVLEVEGGNAIHDQAIVSVQLGTAPAGDPTWTESTFRLLGDETIGGLTGSAGATRIVDLGANTLTLGGNNHNIEFNGRITGAGGIVKVGTGTQVFANANSDYTGGVVVKGGLLIGSLDNRFGAPPETQTPGAITLDGGGIGNTPAASYTIDPNRGITVTGNDGRIHVALSGVSAPTNITVNGAIDGDGRITKTGGGTLTIGGQNAHAGGWDVTDGALVVSAGTGAPLGPGALRVAGSTLGFAPEPGPVPLDTAVTVAGGDGSALAYGNGAVLSVSRNFENSITVTIGGATPPAGGALVREANGTLVVSYVNALGDPGAERVLVSGGGVPLTNGIVSPTIIGARASDGNGDFLTYDATDGFKIATYTATDLNAAGPTSVVSVTTPQNMGGDRTVYALRLEGDFRTSLGGTLTVGAAGGPSTVIMNGGFLDGGTLALPGEGILHASVRGFPSEIGSRITGAGGITKTGDGELVIGNDANTFTGGLRITAGTLTAGVDNVIPASNNVSLSGTGTLNLRGTTQRVGSLSGSYRTVLNLDAGALTVGAGDGQFLGRVIGGGTLAKDGPGVLTLGEERHHASKPSQTNSYAKLAISGGGTVAVSNIVSLPGNPVVLTPDTIALDNGTLRIASENYSALGQAAASTLGGGTGFNRGITVGPGGGTVDVVNPYEIVLWQRGNAAANAAVLLSGSGTFTKTGAGVFRLGPGNAGDPAVAGDGFTGKFRVMGGNLQFQEGGSLGEAPATLVPDQFQIGDGGMIQSNGFGQIEATRGTTLLGGEAFFNTASGSFTFNGPITGPGGITKVGSTATTAINLAAANDFQGDLKLLNGRINLNASNAAGQGDIVLKPEYPVILGKSAGTDDSVIPNDITAAAGSSISLQVDGTSTGRLVLNGNVSGDARRLFKTGVGNLVLGGANSSFGGQIVLQQGTLTVSGANALGAAGPAAHTVVNPGATLAFDNANHTGAEVVYVSGAGVADGGAIQSVGATGSNFAGSVVATRDASVVAANPLAIAGGVRVGRNSTLTRSGAAVLATGPVQLGNGATLSLNEGATTVKHVRGDKGRLSFVGDATAAVAPDGTDAGTSVLDVLEMSGSPGAWQNELDLTNNDLIVRADDPAERDAKLATIEDMVKTARDTGPAGRWTGNGLTSSAARANSVTALVVAPNFGLTTFSGQSVGANDVLVKYTYNGDANLDGRVNADDYFRIDQGFLSQPANPHYRDGDFNDDGRVNADDYFLIDQAFLGQGQPLDATGIAGTLSAIAVPEPGTLTVVALGAAGLLARRRRK